MLATKNCECYLPRADSSSDGIARSIARPDDTNGGAGKQASSRTAETLEYLSQLIAELRQIADRSGQPTLSAILSAALTEVHVQKDQDHR
jgi:hypothetical protein